MGFDEKKGEDKKEATAVSETNKVADSDAETDNEGGGGRPMSESSFYTTEEEEDEDTANKIQLGPQVTLKEQFEKDKDDESLRRWKEQLLGSVDINAVGEFAEHDIHFIRGFEYSCAYFNFSVSVRNKYNRSRTDAVAQLMINKERIWFRHVKYLTQGCPDLEWQCGSIRKSLEAEVKILSLSILSPGRSEIVLPIPRDGNPPSPWFTLKEGSRYSLKFAFQVSNNIVSGLKYTNTVWKTGMKVDGSKEMIGTFSPQLEPYTHEMPEETTPSGMFARGSYSARTKFLDDDNKCHLEINYTFEIKKEWAATE
nr:rho GDP-dissociation inhibitor 1-like [Ipomoea batatas]